MICSGSSSLLNIHKLQFTNINYSLQISNVNATYKCLLYKHKCYIEFLATEKNRI